MRILLTLLLAAGFLLMYVGQERQLKWLRSGAIAFIALLLIYIFINFFLQTIKA